MARPPASIASYIDHTLLRAEATAAEIDRLCDEAREWGFAAVCVNPVWVSQCATRLDACGVVVCSVVAFPLGASTTDIKVAEAERAIRDGAGELDMVVALGHVKAGDWRHVHGDIAAVVGAADGARVKAIIETAILTPAEITTVSAVAREAGAHLVKTSTGFAPSGATHDDLRLMRANTSPHVQVKAAGGVRTLDAPLDVLALGTTRVGATATKTIIDDFRARKSGAAPVAASAGSEGGY